MFQKHEQYSPLTQGKNLSPFLLPWGHTHSQMMSKAAHPTRELSPQQHCLSIPGAPTSGLTSSPLHDLLIVADPPSPENLLHLLTCSSCTINLIRLVPSSKYQVPFLFPCCCCCCCCCSVTKSCLTLCDPMDCSTPGFLVLHYLLEIAQTHVH